MSQPRNWEVFHSKQNQVRNFLLSIRNTLESNSNILSPFGNPYQRNRNGVNYFEANAFHLTHYKIQRFLHKKLSERFLVVLLYTSIPLVALRMRFGIPLAIFNFWLTSHIMCPEIIYRNTPTSTYN